MRMDFMHEFVEVVLVTLAEVDEGLHRLIRVCGCILLSALLNDLEVSS